MKIQVVIKTQFPAIHCWRACPLDEVSFLRDPHRHVFHAVLKFAVTHTDRDIEFISMKNKVEDFIQTRFYNQDLGTTSCEDIAVYLLKEFGAVFVSIFEDNENGAEVYADNT